MKRPFANFVVEQRTKDGYFNATTLIKQWNSTENLHTPNSGYVKKSKGLGRLFQSFDHTRVYKSSCRRKTKWGKKSLFSDKREKRRNMDVASHVYQLLYVAQPEIQNKGLEISFLTRCLPTATKQEKHTKGLHQQWARYALRIR